MQIIVLIGFCILMYIIVYVFGKKETIPSVAAEDWRQFEFSVAKMFEQQGYRTYVTEATQDGGKDLIIYDDDDRVYYVECKYYSDAKIGRPLVQKLVGAMTADSADGGFFVSTSDFTKEALEYAKRANVVCMTVNRTNTN